eukprot:TRINITY_DN2524_c0_g1_i5.p2 TRINITY_DN2524_c0_g1~~TRINITY_DN2524_c0_g1_i5.p2  ORF type:complete len:276 (+),score=45.58 TRINITY_DN2524_c0_g1_i5:1007-1834(+)
MAGVVESNQNMYLGPDGNGNFIPVQVKSVHTKRIPVRQAVAGQSAGFALKKIKRSTIRKGMVLVSIDSKPRASWSFTAEVIILYHSTTIHTNYQPVIQCLTMRQSAKIVHIYDRDVLRTGDRAKVKFRFLYNPEYLKNGMRIIFREGRCKGIGIITNANCDDEDTTTATTTATATATTTKDVKDKGPKEEEKSKNNTSDTQNSTKNKEKEKEKEKETNPTTTTTATTTSTATTTATATTTKDVKDKGPKEEEKSNNNKSDDSKTEKVKDNEKKPK